MASSRSESASSAPVGSMWWIQLNIPLKITAKCHGQYRYFIVFPLIRVSRARHGFCLDDWGSGEEDNTHPMMHLSLNGAYLLSFSFHSFFFYTAGDELPGEWIGMRRSFIQSRFLLPRGDLTDDTRADQDPQRGEGRLKDFLQRLWSAELDCVLQKNNAFVCSVFVLSHPCNRCEITKASRTEREQRTSRQTFEI